MKNKVADKVFEKGNKKDGKHYWLTPDSVYDFIKEKFGINREQLFDPCPYPRPEGFDGLEVEWGKWTYVNPPFGVLDKLVLNKKGKLVKKKIGGTAWFRKAKEECEKGNNVLFVFPIHNWLVEAMIYCGASVYHLGNVKWLAIEDGLPGKGCGAIAMFVLKAKNK
jgi:hypothetical protein